MYKRQGQGIHEECIRRAFKGVETEEEFKRYNELFVRAGIERYTEVTGSDGKTYYVYNEEDTSDTSYMYSFCLLYTSAI